MTVLLIEDSQSLAESLIELLNANGVKVVWVNNGHDAHDKIQNDAWITKVLSDWDLGPYDKRDGGEIVASLKECHPAISYAIYSGLERRVSDGVTFFTKDRLVEVINWCTE